MGIVHGNDSSETLDAADGATNTADQIYGYGGEDWIYGLGGDDWLKGGGGADHLFGGSGLDTASYADSTEGVSVHLPEGRGYGGTATGDSFDSIENVTGSIYDDWLFGDGGANVLNGLAGPDHLFGYGGSDTINGGDGDDVVAGDDGVDTLNGGANNDMLEGGAAADVINGGDGNDTASYTFSPVGVFVSLVTGAGFNGEAERDRLTSIENLNGSQRDDLLVGDDRPNRLFASTGNDNVKGGGGTDTLIGGAGNDTLDGGSDADIMSGEWDNDTYYVDNARDEVHESGGEGADTVRASVSYVLTPGADVETLQTTNDAGTSGLSLTGNSSGQVVRGNNGNNVINGGDGNDELRGLGGLDSFLFDNPLNAATNVDRLPDFNVTDDTIRLDRDIFASDLAVGSSVAGSQFVVGTAAEDAGDRIIYNNATGAVYYDSDGLGGVDQIQFARLNAGLGMVLTNFDFLVVA